MNELTSKYKKYVGLLIALIVLVAFLFYFFKPTGNKPGQNFNTGYLNETSEKDSVISPPDTIKIFVHDTIPKYLPKYIKAANYKLSPGDSIFIAKLEADREHLAKILDSLNLKAFYKWDTTFKEPILLKTLIVNREVFTGNMTVDFYKAAQTIKVKETKIFVPVQQPQKWYENPYVTAGGGLILGYLVGKALSK